MSFPISVARNNSESISVTKNLTVLFELNGVLKDNCDIIDPVFLVETSVDALSQANYLIVPTFNRRYFIQKIVSVRNLLTEIQCHVDVLSSFADAIKANKGIVHRQEADWNLYLNDGVLKCYQNPLVNTVSFPNGFSGHTNVLLLSGQHGGGTSSGVDAGGAGGFYSKTTSGLVAYARAQLGKPYWYGTFGNTADQLLLDHKRLQYPSEYTATDFDQQFGQRVHDCVGLIKGYRWSETFTSTPVYVAAQDVDVKGMWSQCTKSRVQLITGNSVVIGSVVFTRDSSHCGVYVGEGKVVEARGHAYGVVETNLSDRNFLWAAVPSWCQITTGSDVL